MDNPGTTILDRSGNGKDGTINSTSFLVPSGLGSDLGTNCFGVLDGSSRGNVITMPSLTSTLTVLVK